MVLTCPVCSETLQEKNEHFICPRGHGLFLTLKSFRKTSSSWFVSWLYAHWLRRTSARKNHCPACKDLMMSLHNNVNDTLSFEFCPSCFGSWLSSATEQELIALYEFQEKEQNKIENPMEVLGRILIEHDKTLMKYEALTRFGNFLTKKARRRFFRF